MAHSKQAAKRARQSLDARARNMAMRSAFRTALKKVRTAISSGDAEQALGTFQQMQSVLDKIGQKGVFHRNKVARHKSRLHAKIKAMTPQATA